MESKKHVYLFRRYPGPNILWRGSVREEIDKKIIKWFVRTHWSHSDGAVVGYGAGRASEARLAECVRPRRPPESSLRSPDLTPPAEESLCYCCINYYAFHCQAWISSKDKLRLNKKRCRRMSLDSVYLFKQKCKWLQNTILLRVYWKS